MSVEDYANTSETSRSTVSSIINQFSGKFIDVRENLTRQDSIQSCSDNRYQSVSRRDGTDGTEASCKTNCQVHESVRVTGNQLHSSLPSQTQEHAVSTVASSRCGNGSTSNILQKMDASTMTEKETQTNDTYHENECGKTTLSPYSVHSVIPPTAWHSLAAPPGSAVAEYLSRLPASTLPLTLHHFLEFSPSSPQPASDIYKKDMYSTKKKNKKYKKKPYIPRPPRPRPGQIHLTTALDGSTLFCCPECNMAYPEKDLLEQHLLVHKLERRFVCDICGAGLKRKEHLDRHKQGHNPERPYVCTICMKAFKRNEHLSRHFVIHSGDKAQVCSECGKSFYRKDHLRKHTQSHVTRRIRSDVLCHKENDEHMRHSVVSLTSVVSPIDNDASPPGIRVNPLMSSGNSLPILSS